MAVISPLRNFMFGLEYDLEACSMESSFMSIPMTCLEFSARIFVPYPSPQARSNTFLFFENSFAK